MHKGYSEHMRPPLNEHRYPKTICPFVNKRHAEELMRAAVSLFRVNMGSQMVEQATSHTVIL